MKELSIEEKAKRYDEAIEQLRKMMPNWDNLSYNGKTFIQDLVYILPELKESDDEKIRKELIQFFSDKDEEDYEGLHPRVEILDWLKKQCALAEFCDSIQVGDKVTRNQDGVLVNLYQLNRVAKKDEKQGEQTSDKVEPKFEIEEGEWYICIRDLLDNYANRAFCKGYIYLSTQNGSLIPSNSNVPFKIVCPDTYFRHWTIQDAKDGDVLVDDLGNICIYQEPSTKLMYHSFCYGNHKWFIDCGGSHKIVGTCPATLKQRDLLFKKMKEAGYEWDAEKKELKMIEQKPAWSEEDEKQLNDIIELLPDLSNRHNWLKSLKDRVQPKQEWSEEDEELLRDVSDTYFYNDEDYPEETYKRMLKKVLDWMNKRAKSLRSQSTWKPSKEQITVLHDVAAYIDNSIYPDQKDILVNLYLQLKKLMEE